MIEDTQILQPSYLIRQLPTNTIFIDKQFKIIHASDTWIKTFFNNDRSAVGLGLFNVLPEISSKWKNVLEDCFLGKSNSMGIHQHNNLDNKLWYEWSYSPWYNANENIIGAILHCNDVTSLVKSIYELEKNKSLLNQQSEISKTGIWEYNSKTKTLIWCPMTKSIHEVPHNYIPKMDEALEFYKEGFSRNAFSMALHEATEKGLPWHLELQIRTAKGNEKWVMSSGKPVFKKNKVVGFIGTCQDITDQVEVTLESLKNEKLLRTLVDNLPVNVYIKDLESKKLLVNKAECDFMGIDNADAIIGKSDFDLHPYESALLSRNEDLKIFESGQAIIGKETIAYNHDGTETFFLTSKIPLLDSEGKIYGLVGISLDITNIKQKEKELRQLINVTSQQNKKLVDFAHIVSHNLRSHSANFSMLLDLMPHEEDEKEKEKILTMLTTASSDLLESLNYLNEVVKITNELEAEKSTVNLSTTLDKIISKSSLYLTEHKAKIVNDISRDIAIQLVPAYLEDILLNFITNSVKFRHPDRTPELRFSTKKTTNQTILSIEDNGIGIDLNKYGDKLFGMYNTFHAHENAKGIGLYLVKNLIEAMNGTITVESTVGIGTKFEIHFNEKN